MLDSLKSACFMQKVYFLCWLSKSSFQNPSSAVPAGNNLNSTVAVIACAHSRVGITVPHGWLSHLRVKNGKRTYIKSWIPTNWQITAVTSLAQLTRRRGKSLLALPCYSWLSQRWKMQSLNIYKLAENLKANENPFVSWKKPTTPIRRKRSMSCLSDVFFQNETQHK